MLYIAYLIMFVLYPAAIIIVLYNCYDNYIDDEYDED